MPEDRGMLLGTSSSPEVNPWLSSGCVSCPCLSQWIPSAFFLMPLAAIGVMMVRKGIITLIVI